MSRRVRIFAFIALVLLLALNAPPNSPTRAATGPDLAITKSSPTPFQVGIDGTFNFVVQNVGDTATTGNIDVTDTLPQGLTYKSASVAITDWDCAASTVGTANVSCRLVANGGVLGAGAFAPTLAIVVTVPPSAYPNFTNVGNVTELTGEPNFVNNHSSLTVNNVTGAPDLTVASQTHTTFFTGVTGSFTIRIQNHGTAQTSGQYQVHDVLPPNFTFIANGQYGTGWTCSSGGVDGTGHALVDCTTTTVLQGFGSTGQNTAPDLTIPTQPTAAGTNLTNTVTVSGGTEPTSLNTDNTSTDSTVGVTASPELGITKTDNVPVGGNFTVGVDATYTLTVHNATTAGTAFAPITVQDTLPNGLTFVSGSGDNFNCVDGSPVVCTRNTHMVANETANINIVVHVLPAAGTAGSVTNTAKVVISDPQPGNDTATKTTTVKSVVLAVTKSHTPQTPTVGQQVTFTFVVQNTAGPNAGNTVGNITITDPLPTGLTFATGSVTGANWSCTGTPLVCTYDATVGGAIAPGASTTVSFKADVGTTIPASITNVGTVAGGGNSGTNVSASDGPITVLRPDLTITKTHPGNLAVGVSNDYTITVTNSGTGDTTGNITVTDNLPDTFNLVSATGSGWTCTPAGATPASVPDISCVHPGPATAGGSLPNITIRVTPTTAGTVHNLATVANGSDVNTTNNGADDQTVVGSAPAPDLAITKTITTPFIVNTNGAYTIHVSNEGVGPTSGTIQVKDTMPLSFTIVTPVTATGWNCGVVGNIVTCDYTGTAVNGGSNPVGSDIIITAKATTTLGSPFTNTASVTNIPTGTAETNLANNIVNVQTTVTPQAATDLTITKTHVQNFTTTGNGTYTITVTNIGTVDSAGVITVIDNLPTSFGFVSGGGSGFTCNGPAPTITCSSTAATVLTGNGGTVSFPIVVQASAAGPFTNNAVVSGGGDANSTNNTDDDPTTVTTTAVPDLEITKTHTPAAGFTAGGQGQYNITVTNIGTANTSPAEPTIVTDTLPAGLTYVPTGSGGTGWSPCTVNGQVITCQNNTPVTAGSSLPTLTLIVNVASTASGTLVNNASVSIPSSDPNTANNAVSHNTLVSGIVDLAMFKTHPGNFQQGVNGIYTLTVQNIGAASTSGQYTVTDTLPTGLVPLSAVGTGWTCTIAGQLVTCNRTTVLTAGASTSIQVTVDVQAGALGTFTNKATVSGGGNVVGQNDDAFDPTTTTVGAAPDITISKSHTGDFVIGTNGTFNIVVRNIGTGASSGTINVTDTLPAGLTFVAAGSGGSGFGCSAAGQVVTCTSAATITSGANLPINIVVSVSGSPTTVSNTATVTQPTGDANPGNDSATDSTVNIVTAPPPSATNSTINVFPTTAQANNTDVVTVQVTVRTTVNQPVGAGVQVNLAADGAPAGLTISGNGTASTNASGVASFTVSSAVVQTVSLYATLAADATQTHITNVPTGGSRTVSFTQPVNPLALSSALSTISASPTSVTADGSSYSTVIVHVAQNNGLAAAGASVTIFSNVSGPTATPSTTTTTDINGNATFQVRDAQNQTVTITAQAANIYGTITIPGSVTITFGSGTTTPTSTPTGGSSAGGTQSSFTTSCTSIPSDNVTTASLTATLRNGSSQALSGKTVTVTFTPALSGMSLTPTSAVTDSNGNASFTVRSVTQGGPVTFTATDTTDSITISQTVAITFTAVGTPSNCSAAASGVATAVPGTAGAIGVGLLGAPSNGPSIGVVVPYILCVRSGPGTNYPALGRFKGGTQLVLLGKNPLGTAKNFPPRTDCQRGRGGATWFMVQLDNNQVGWVSAFYIRVKRLEFRHLPIVDVPGAVQP